MFSTDLSDNFAETHVSALNTFETEQSLALASGNIQLVQYNWGRPTSDVWTADGYFLHMTLTPRPTAAQATYLDRDKRVTQNIGRVMFVPPGRKMHTLGGMGTQKSLHCMLHPPIMEKLLGREPNWDNATLAEALNLNRPEVDCVLFRIQDELCNPGFAQEFMADSLLNALAVTLVRSLRLHREEPVASIGGLAPWRMRLIRARVYSDLPAPQLTELAQLCKMSVRHLTRAFRAEADMTIASFVEHAMVDRARQLLSNSDYSIVEISTRLGFASSSSFTYAFRRATGLPPAEFRRRSYPVCLVNTKV